VILDDLGNVGLPPRKVERARNVLADQEEREAVRVGKKLVNRTSREPTQTKGAGIIGYLCETNIIIRESGFFGGNVEKW
jgi:hypothetical protein